MLPVAKHPIRVVTARTGLSADVLRASERRYQVVEPSRSGGHRAAVCRGNHAGNRLAPRHGLKLRGLGAKVFRDLEQFRAWLRSTR